MIDQDCWIKVYEYFDNLPAMYKSIYLIIPSVF